MGRKFRTKPKKTKPPNPRPKIDYPPVPTKKWVPPDKRKKPAKAEPKYVKPEGVSQKLAISTLRKCWHLYEIFGDAAIILGHFSQKHKRFSFKSNDLQGACISAVACAYQKLYIMETWDAYRLDEIILQGDKLYVRSTMQGDKCLIMVPPEKMYTSFWLGSYKVTLQTDQNGKVKKDLTASSEDKSKEIMENTLGDFLKEYQSGIFSIKDKYAAFWTQDGAYYFFDSGEHDAIGIPYIGAPGWGLSLLARYKKLRSLVDCVFRNFPDAKAPNAEFELLGCEISRIVQVQTQPPETFEDIAPQEIVLKPEEEPAPLPDLKLQALKAYVVLDKVPPDPVKKMAQEMSPFVSEDMFADGNLRKPSFLEDAPFERVDEGRYSIPIPTYVKMAKTKLTYYIEVEYNQQGILRGKTCQTDARFSKYGGRQSMGNALSALIMLRIQKSKLWIPSFVDYILQQGDVLFQDAMKSIPRTHSLRLVDFPKKIEYKGRFFGPEIDEYALVGQLNSQDFEVLDLGPALEFFLSEHDCCIILGPLTLAVWLEDGVYYMFDPNERDQHGKAILKVDTFTSEDTVTGVACVTWFKDLKKLVELYVENTDKPKREDRFYLSRVKVKDYCEVPDDWYQFKGLCLGKWILRGTFYQGSYRFSPESRNFQGTANAFMSLAMVSLVNLEEWDIEVVDEILTIGDQLYKSSVQNLQDKQLFINPMLMLSELKKFQRLRDKEANFEVEECAVNGLIFARKESDLPDLYKGLERFFKDNDMGVVTSREISVAVWKKGQYYYYLDPYSRDSKGLPAGYGTSCVVRTLCLEDFAKFIEFNLDPKAEDTYNIANIKVTLYEAGAEGAVKPPLNHYTKIDENSAILRSWLSENSDVFDSYRRARQTIPMCLTAVCFNKLKPSREWTKNDMDDILVKGDALYVDSMANAQKQLLEASQGLYETAPAIVETSEAPVKQDLQAGGDAKPKKNRDEAPPPPTESEEKPPMINEAEQDDEEDEEPELEVKITSENVKTEFCMGPNSFHVEYPDVQNYQAPEGPIKEYLINTIKERFEQEQTDDWFNSEVLLESKHYSVVIWRDDKAYYVFDSKPRDKNGNCIGNEDWDPEPLEPVEPVHESIREDEEVETEEKGPPTYDDEEEIEDVKPDIRMLQEKQLDEKYQEELEDEENEQDKGRPPKEEVPDEEQEQEQEQEEFESAPPSKPKKSPSFWNEQEKSGRGCTVWFLNTDDLANYIYNNFPPEDRAKGKFTLTNVKITNALKLKNKWNPEDQMNTVYDGDWYDFQEVDQGMWIIRASGDLTSPIFPEKNRGKQTLTASLIALSIKHIYELTCFVSTTPDTMLMYGDKLYSYLRKIRKKQWIQDPNSNLGEEEVDWLLDHYEFQIKDIPKRICMSKFMVDVKITPNVISGDTKAQDFEEVMDIKRGLGKFFEENKYGILQSKGLYVAVWRGIKIYYMFDGLKRGPNGVQSIIGVGCLTRYLDLGKLAEVFCANLPTMGTNEFLIHKVVLSRDLCPREREPKEQMPIPKTVQKSAVLKTVIPGKAIIRGTISQEDPKFGKLPGMMSSPIAIVALTMTLIHKPEIWTRPFIDDIVFAGAELYEESTNELGFEFNQWEDILDIYKVKNDYKVGVMKANCELRNTDQKGIINIKDPVVKNLRKGIENFFEENTHGIVVTEPLTLAIWEQPQDDGPPLIYIFDPNPRGATGMPLFTGTACVVSFANAKLASDHIIGCILDPDRRSGEFTIVPVEIVVEDSIRTPHKLERSATKSSSINVVARCSKLVASEQKRVLRKLAQEERKRKEQKRINLIGRQGYHPIKGGEAILRGYKHQNHESYGEDIRNMQDIPNCIVSVVMHSVLPIDEWNHKHIDIILDAGNQLYIDSYIAYCPKLPRLGLENIMRKFVMGDLEVHTTVYKPIISERFSSGKLAEILDVFFQQEPVCLVNYKDNWVTAFFKAGYFYLFDPHERDIDGDPINNDSHKQGTAVVIKFESLNSVAMKIYQNLADMSYTNDEQEKEVFTLWIVSVETKTNK